MPKKFLPSQSAITAFFDDITNRLGCVRISAKEIVDWVESIPNSEPLSRYKQAQTGMEIGYKYTTPTIPVQVIIWTTYVAGNQQARASDAGWVLIVEKKTRKPIFFSFPIHRTKNFLKTLTRYIEVFIEIVTQWPTCATCAQSLTIKPVSGVLLGKTFACPQGHVVRGWIYQGVSDSSRKFLEARYRAYARYRETLPEHGTGVTPRVFIRAGVSSVNRKKQDVDTTSQASPHPDNYSQVNPQTEQYPFNDLQYEE